MVIPWQIDYTDKKQIAQVGKDVLMEFEPDATAIGTFEGKSYKVFCHCFTSSDPESDPEEPYDYYWEIYTSEGPSGPVRELHDTLDGRTIPILDFKYRGHIPISKEVSLAEVMERVLTAVEEVIVTPMSRLAYSL